MIYPHYISLSLHDTSQGKFYIPDNSKDEIANAMRSDQVFDAGVVQEIFKHMRPNSVAIDVGSSFGQMTICFAKQIGPEGHVYSFEVDPYAHMVTCMSIGANHLSNVTAYRAAAWNTDGETVFYEPPGRGGSTYGRQGIDLINKRGIPVQTMTIDSLQLENVSVIKSDAQGSDLYVLQGATETIKRCRPAVLFEHEPQRGCGAARGAYEEFLSAVDYRFTANELQLNNLLLPREKVE